MLLSSLIPSDGLLYQFDKEKSVLTDKRFEFNLYPEHSENQKHYEALGDVCSTYYSMTRLQLHISCIPDHHRPRIRALTREWHAQTEHSLER